MESSIQMRERGGGRRESEISCEEEEENKDKNQMNSSVHKIQSEWKGNKVKLVLQRHLKYSIKLKMYQVEKD